MPELPEVETICRRLAPEVTGRKIRAVHILRPSVTKPQQPATLAKLASGRTIRHVRRRGKNILIELSGGLTIHAHLRMTGQMYLSRDGDGPPSVRLWFELAGGTRLVFKDSRALGVVHIHRSEDIPELLEKLGPEPLSPDFTPERLIEEAKRSRQPAKLFLMDQQHVAGLGNIYAAEALFRARINPRKPVNRLKPAQLKALHSAILDVLREALKSASIAYTDPGEFREAESFECAVYDREGEPCRVCGRSVRRIPQGGRSTYYCPGCQK